MNDDSGDSDDGDLAEVLPLMDCLIERQRVYASFRELGPKEIKEADVVRDLLQVLRAPDGEPYRDLRLAQKDPPDCIALNQRGESVAIEVTEFVSEEAVRLNEHTRRRLDRRPEIHEMVMAQWTCDDFVQHLRGVLAGKDEKTLHGGPFKEYVVIVHTDEPLLVWTVVEEWLAKEAFGPFRQITSAHLLFSYHPGQGYPVVPLQVHG